MTCKAGSKTSAPSWTLRPRAHVGRARPDRVAQAGMGSMSEEFIS